MNVPEYAIARVMGYLLAVKAVYYYFGFNKAKENSKMYHAVNGLICCLGSLFCAYLLWRGIS
ncbi:MAG: hypothetical protein PHN69_03905 [Candidatus Pacebacteria bacterium]|nr:hypothetical protein [Candidatus Paceibacterota bacterium]